MTLAQVKAAIDRGDDIRLYDANSLKSHLASQVQGAIWLRYDDVSVEKLPASKAATLAFYCCNPLCRASPLAAKRMRRSGYTNVWTMPAGISGWKNAGMPVVTGDRAC